MNMNSGNGNLSFMIHTFPYYSMTFVVNELEELRAMGVDFKIYAVRRPVKEELVPEQGKYLGETIYMTDSGILKIVRTNAAAFIKNPPRYIIVFFYLVFRREVYFKEKMRSLFYFLLSVSFYPRVKNDNITHIHVHTLSGVAVAALVLFKLYGVPYSLTAHGTDIFVERVLLKEKISHAVFTRVGTQYNRNYLMGFFKEGFQPSVVSMPFGIDVGRFDGFPRRERVGPLRILNVGRLVWQKAQGLLLQACAHVKERGVSFRLTIIGEGDRRAELESLLDRLGLGDFVSMPGRLDESSIARMYGEADVFVLSSISEGFGIVILEAMACGLPVIAPALHGIPEIIEDGVDGRLFETDSMRALSEALMEMEGDAEKRYRLGKAAQRKVRENYRLAVSVSRFHELLVDCLWEKS